MKENIPDGRFVSSPRFPVFHVPHDGREFPAELVSSVCIPWEEFRAYHEKMRDTDMRAVIPDSYSHNDSSCVFPVSRLLCDPERFLGPEESMEQYGMGFCYEKAYDGRVIKSVTEELREKTLRYYRAHHARLDGICERHPRILFLDLHSYSDEILPPERRGGSTPDLCIGTEERFTPAWLKDLVRKHFLRAGFSVAENTPYPGCLIPDAVLSGRADCDLIGIMLEIHRRAYCDENGKSIPEKLSLLQETVRRITEECPAAEAAARKSGSFSPETGI